MRRSTLPRIDILGYDFKKFDEYVVLLGPVKARRISTDLSPTKNEVEGQVTRILYVARRVVRRSRCYGTTSRS